MEFAGRGRITIYTGLRVNYPFLVPRRIFPLLIFNLEGSEEKAAPSLHPHDLNDVISSEGPGCTNLPSLALLAIDS